MEVKEVIRKKRRRKSLGSRGEGRHQEVVRRKSLEKRKGKHQGRRTEKKKHRVEQTTERRIKWTKLWPSEKSLCAPLSVQQLAYSAFPLSFFVLLKFCHSSAPSLRYWHVGDVCVCVFPFLAVHKVLSFVPITRPREFSFTSQVEKSKEWLVLWHCGVPSVPDLLKAALYRRKT